MAALCSAADGPSVRRSAQPGAVSPFNSWTPGAPRYRRLSLPVGKHAEQTLHAMGTPLGPSQTDTGSGLMDVIYERCCGLDIHKRSVVACLIVPGPEGMPRKD